MASNFGVTVATTNMNNPYGMTMNPFGNIVVADSSYQRIISFGLMCRKFHFLLLFISLE